MPHRIPRPDTPALVWPGKHPPTPGSATAFLPDLALGSGRDSLIHADNLAVLRWLLSPRGRRASLRGRPLDLIYIDPPYAMRAHHGVHLNGADVPAYDDSWTASGPAYLQFMFERLTLMHRLLSDRGALFVHCDWRAVARLRLILDEVFGEDCFRNEIVWRRAPNLGRQAASRQLGRVADSILVYSKSHSSPFRGSAPVLRKPMPLSPRGVPVGGRRDPSTGEWFTLAPRGDYTDQSIARLEASGRIHRTPRGSVYIKYPLRRDQLGRFWKDQPADTIWDDPAVRPLRHASRRELDISYTTQKPESLLERIINWASAPGDIVADFFCGSGTTLAVAQRLGRRWIGCDSGALAIHTTAKRLVDGGAQWTLWRDADHAGQGGWGTLRCITQVKSGRRGTRIHGVTFPALPDSTSSRTLRVTRSKRASPTKTTPHAIDLLLAGPVVPKPGKPLKVSFVWRAGAGNASLAPILLSESRSAATEVRAFDNLGRPARTVIPHNAKPIRRRKPL